MPHRQLCRYPVVARCGVGSQKDRELRLAVVAFSQAGQSRQRRGQSELADALAQDSQPFFLAAVPVGSISPAGAANPMSRRALQHLEQLVLEGVLAEIPATRSPNIQVFCKSLSNGHILRLSRAAWIW